MVPILHYTILYDFMQCSACPCLSLLPKILSLAKPNFGLQITKAVIFNLGVHVGTLVHEPKRNWLFMIYSCVYVVKIMKESDLLSATI